MIEVCIRAGGQPIGQIQISRRTGSDDHHNLNTYDVGVRLHNTDPHWLTGVCVHRYGNEWPLLLHEALATIIASHGRTMIRP